MGYRACLRSLEGTGRKASPVHSLTPGQTLTWQLRSEKHRGQVSSASHEEGERGEGGH